MASNAEILRTAVETFSREGMEASIYMFDPKVEWHTPREWIEQPVYHGHDGVRKLATFWLDNFDEYKWVIERAEDLDDSRVLALYTHHGRAKDGGVEIEQRQGSIFTFRDGRAVEIHTYNTHEETLEAAGLSPTE